MGHEIQITPLLRLLKSHFDLDLALEGLRLGRRQQMRLPAPRIRGELLYRRHIAQLVLFPWLLAVGKSVHGLSVVFECVEAFSSL